MYDDRARRASLGRAMGGCLCEDGGMAAEPFFQSEIAFNTARIGAAALYCSDGRYGDQMDDLLPVGCKWPRYDRLAFPGGPASLSNRLSVFWEESTLRKYLEFLVRTHNL